MSTEERFYRKYMSDIYPIDLKHKIKVRSIKTKNEALLNSRDELWIVRYHCNLILKGQDTWEDQTVI